ncbi:uncharacterized protein LOC127104665 [Lathyrus oleraceus]|uniref:uncharacterized protein LOC127104665 n=1 Tax=Pisum sativum TaxID=3888 RepID=UPI0021D3B04F|nr:uncharacterized protein LOC127104665 [Pisum sativum]
MTESCTLFTVWIISHFPHISRWPSEMEYNEDWPRACAFAPYRGNTTIEPYRVFIDRTVAYYIFFCSYDGHRQTRPLDDIAFYSGWLASGSRLMYPHLSERAMRQFGLQQMIPRNPFTSAPLTICHRDLDVILDDFYSHLILEKEHSVPAGDPWAYEHGYIQWFYQVPHPYMISNVAGALPRPAHQEILEEVRAWDDHTVDLLSLYRDNI